MPYIFDTHAHYDSEKFEGSRDDVLSALPSANVCTVVNCATDIPSAYATLELARRYYFVYAAVGIHPHEAEDVPDDYIDTLRTLAAEDKVVAIGEAGLDYHYDFSPRDIQRKVFREQLELARELDMPIIVHDREAHEDTYRLLREFKPKGVVHCFSGSVELAMEAIRYGMYIGLGGAVTFKNARVPLEVAAAIPLERLLLETDAPYMAPVPYRGKLCTSAMIEQTAQVIAQIRGISYDDLLCVTEQNAKALYNMN